MGGYRWTLQLVLGTSRAHDPDLRQSLFGVTIGLFYIIPKGFIPNDDTSRIVGYTEAAEGISFEEMSRHQEQMVDIIRANPNVVGVLSTVGESDVSAASNTGNHSDSAEANHPAETRALMPSSKTCGPNSRPCRGCESICRTHRWCRLAGQVTKSPYQLTLQGPDRNELYANAEVLQKKMAALPELLDVTSDMQNQNPQLNVDIDRDKASSLGITCAASRGCPQQCLWHEADLDDLCDLQRIPGDSRG